MIACLMICGCGSPRVVTRTKIVYATPPAQYLQERPIPKLQSRKNGDLLNWALDLRSALEEEIADKEALRRWKKNVEKGDQ